MKETGFWAWLVKSSSNPEEVSMTVKGALMLWVPAIIAILKLKGIIFDDGVVMDVINGISGVVMVAFGLVGAVYTVIGLIRKLYFTIKK